MSIRPKPEGNDDRELVQRLLAGEEAAFISVVQDHWGGMMRLARAIAGDRLAEDVVQETWLAMVKALPGYQGRACLRTWILGILTNVARNHLRRKAREPMLEQELGPGSVAVTEERFDRRGHWRIPPATWHDEGPEALLCGEELCHCLEEALHGLPPMQQAVINLRDVEGLSMTEICNILDISATNGRVLLHRARSRLHRAADRYCREGVC